MTLTLIKATQGEQVAGELEKRIKGGEIALGRKMPSTRELALQFDVSRQVIESAFGMLESRRLILRKPRIGTYVNPESVTKCRMDLCLLRLQCSKCIIDYTEKLLSLSDTDVWNGCNLSIRSISESNYSLGILRYELEKLRQTHLDCLLVFIPDMTRKELDEFKHLPFPVVFLGDILPEGKLDRSWTQISEATADRAKAMVTAAAGYGYRHAVLVSGSLDVYFSRIMKEAGEQAARELGIGFTYSELDERGPHTDKELAVGRAENICKALTAVHADVFLLDGFRQLDMIVAELEARGLQLHRDLDLITDGELCSGTIYLKSDYTAMSQEVLHLIHSMLKVPGKPLERIVVAGKIKRSPLKIDWDWNNFTPPKRRN